MNLTPPGRKELKKLKLGACHHPLVRTIRRTRRKAYRCPQAHQRGSQGQQAGLPSSRPWSGRQRKHPGQGLRPREARTPLSDPRRFPPGGGRSLPLSSSPGRCGIESGDGCREEGRYLARADSFALFHPQPQRRPGLAPERVRFAGKGVDALWLASHLHIPHPRCLSSAKPGSSPPHDPQPRPLLSSTAHTPRPRPPPQATCAPRGSRRPAATVGLVPGAGRRLRARRGLWSLLQRLLGSVVPQAGCGGPRAGGPGRKNLASCCLAPAESGCLSVAVGSHLASPGQGQRSQQETAAACARGAHRGAINAGFGDPVVALKRHHHLSSGKCGQATKSGGLEAEPTSDVGEGPSAVTFRLRPQKEPSGKERKEQSVQRSGGQRATGPLKEGVCGWGQCWESGPVRPPEASLRNLHFILRVVGTVPDP
ncbi:hypothetical protein Cadr_000026253 [Camelus dromedarius]|uniref:Uncharacterized protein n=1 Tax=Camelus dromedarius TaxID=9838 RepID=A0A5N4CE21_CAMDR|nr:hypothetical protein Cadr_000026253 [Camelus dromedarius]